MIHLLTLACALNVLSMEAQVGINNANPQAALDIQSSNSGVVMPRLALTSTLVESPASNPQGAGIPAGTVIYNTATTNNGVNDVSPGLYVWTGTQWSAQFDRKEHMLYESDLGIRTEPLVGFAAVNIGGLTNLSFTPSYSGVYKIILSVNYGGGVAKTPNEDGSPASDGDLNIARQTGTFDFELDGVHRYIPVGAYSTNYDSSVGIPTGGDRKFFAIWQEYHWTGFVSLSAGVAHNFNLSFTQDAAPEFVGDGTGTGRGYIAYDLPCRVEFIYMGD
ncbi:MAG: hypothetical protein ACPF82_07395 [Flavobacteriaceae bacterium]